MHIGKMLLGGLVATMSIFVTVQSADAMPASMALAGNASPPIGHYEFCKANPTDCSLAGGDAGPAILTPERWRTMLKVNYTVNTAIQPMTDEQIYGVEERWAYPRTVGDCEDYALLKRKMLIDDGFSPSDVLMTVVLQPNGDGHAVLTVRTDHGDFVLDNMRSKVLLWSDTEYTYLKRQSADDPARWVKLQDGRAVAVGSVK